MEALENTNNTVAMLITGLIAINNERINYYTMAHEHMRDNADLKSIFMERVRQSQNFIIELKKYIGFSPKKILKTASKDFIRLISVKDRKSTSTNNSLILDRCEFIEDESSKAYDEYVKSTGTVSAPLRQTLIEQHNEIKKSHEFIKKFRDFNLDLTA